MNDMNTTGTPVKEAIYVNEAPRTVAAMSMERASQDVYPAHTIHHYGPSVRIGIAHPEAETQPDEAVRKASSGLDPVGKAGVEAFLMRQSEEFKTAKRNRRHEGRSWSDNSVPGLLPPKVIHPGTEEHRAAFRGAAVPDFTSHRFEGKIAVGVVIVSGPNDLAFSQDEITKVNAEVQNGLSWLATQSKSNGASFYYDYKQVTLALPDDPVNPTEAYWLNPALQAMGYASALDYVNAIIAANGADWGYCGFFVKYSQTWFAYAYLGGPYLCMQYSNDGWGPDNIDRVFAHESGHIFYALDEYSGACSCDGVSGGYYNAYNRNCDPCAPAPVDCIMKANTYAMCGYTPWQLGIPFYFQGDPGNGIGGYNLTDSRDLVTSFDYDSSGKQNYLVLYRPGTGTIWIQKNTVCLPNYDNVFNPVYAQGSPGSGIGGYDLSSDADRVFPFDYDSSGKQDHLVLYRPGTGTIWILKNTSGTFTPVYAQGDPGSGIGGYDLSSTEDRVFAFDYDSSGKLDHLVLYRPGTGTIWILKNTGGAFKSVYAQGCPGSGIGGYDLSSTADRVFAFDYDGSGKQDHLVLYRPGTGTIWILKNTGGTFTPVYAQGDPGSGIGGYDLLSTQDNVLAMDYDRSGKMDHLVLYRPGTGTIWILKNTAGTFSPVYAQGDPGLGIGGYNLLAASDRVSVFDYLGDGTMSGLVLYRPGTGAIAIFPSGPGFQVA